MPSSATGFSTKSLNCKLRPMKSLQPPSRRQRRARPRSRPSWPNKQIKSMISGAGLTSRTRSLIKSWSKRRVISFKNLVNWCVAKKIRRLQGRMMILLGLRSNWVRNQRSLVAILLLLREHTRSLKLHRRLAILVKGKRRMKSLHSPLPRRSRERRTPIDKSRNSRILSMQMRY